MRKKIILIRHSRPCFPDGVRLCLGRRTDIGIGPEGKDAAHKVRTDLAPEIEKAGRIFSSPLKRAVETAGIISGGSLPVVISEGLTEMDMGEWDGLDFNTIKEQYKELYVRRGDDMSLPPPGGEGFGAASLRMRNALKEIAGTSSGDTVIAVSHSGTVRAFLCDLMHMDYRYNRTIPLDYLSVCTVIYDNEKESFEFKEV